MVFLKSSAERAVREALLLIKFLRELGIIFLRLDQRTSQVMTNPTCYERSRNIESSNLTK